MLLPILTTRPILYPYSDLIYSYNYAEWSLYDIILLNTALVTLEGLSLT